MKPINNKIIVSCDVTQKNKIEINGLLLKTAHEFEKNYREKSPTIATVIEGNDIVKAGDILLCHHNLFYPPSPYYLTDNLYSVPFSKILFAKIDKLGDIFPICGNLICNRVPIKYPFPVPIEQQKTEDKIYEVLDSGQLPYNKGDFIFTRPSAGYDIVYTFNNIEKRITKVDSEQICGVFSV